MGVRFSLAGAARERRVETEVGRAVLAEELGFEGMFFSEGLMSGLDPFQICAVAATRTKRVVLGTAILTTRLLAWLSETRQWLPIRPPP